MEPDPARSASAAATLASDDRLLVLDDFTPTTEWPPRYHGEIDERLRYLTDPRLLAVELQVAQDQAVIVAARVGAA